MTVILPATDPEAIARAVAALRVGGLVALPTETVYGLAADARDDRAVARIFRIFSSNVSARATAACLSAKITASRVGGRGRPTQRGADVRQACSAWATAARIVQAGPTAGGG
jgi:hypothetical protein